MLGVAGLVVATVLIWQQKRETEAALFGRRDDLLGILEVGLGAKVEEYADAFAMTADGFAGKIVFGIQSGNLSQ